MTITHLPRKRLSLNYFFYFAIIGALMPYLARYLRAEGFSVAQIGLTAGLLSMMMSLGPWLWAALSDRTGQRLKWARVSMTMVMLGAFVLLFGLPPGWRMAMIASTGFFLAASLPQIEAASLDHLGADTHRYGSLRLWGTLGYAASAWVLAMALAWTGAAALPWMLLVLAAASCAVLIWVQDAPRSKTHERQPAPWSEVLLRLRETPVWGLYVALFLWNWGMAGYNLFFDLYLQALGYPNWAIGGYLALAPIAEALFFLVLGATLTRWGPRQVLVFALLVTVLRWLLTAFLAHQPWLLVLAQSAHALTFGAMHGGAMVLLAWLFPKAQQARAQALYLGLSTGLGLMVGNLVAGQVWGSWGGASAVFVLSAGVTLLAAVLLWRTLSAPALRQAQHSAE